MAIKFLIWIIFSLGPLWKYVSAKVCSFYCVRFLFFLLFLLLFICLSLLARREVHILINIKKIPVIYVFVSQQKLKLYGLAWVSIIYQWERDSHMEERKTFWSHLSPITLRIPGVPYSDLCIVSIMWSLHHLPGWHWGSAVSWYKSCIRVQRFSSGFFIFKNRK